MWGGVPDVVNHAKFRQSWLRGFGSMRVEICHFPMLSAMAYITGQGYLPTCDQRNAGYNDNNDTANTAATATTHILGFA